MLYARTVAATRWLSDAEQRAWRAWLDAVRHVEDRVERQLRDDSGLTGDDYEVMVRLSEAPGRRVRMSDLAAAVHNSPSRLSQRIDRMVRAGLVTRERCPEDRRGAYAVLTDDGFARLAAAAPGHVEAVRRHLIDRLGPEEIDLLAGIMRRIATDDPAAPSEGDAGGVTGSGG